MLEILIPLSQLFDMFEAGVRMMKINSGDDRKPSKHTSKNGSDSHRGGSICKYFLTFYLLIQLVFNLSFLISAPVIEDESPNTSGLSDNEAPTSRQNTTDFETDGEHNLSCCILMLDILLKQVKYFNKILLNISGAPLSVNIAMIEY